MTAKFPKESGRLRTNKNDAARLNDGHTNCYFCKVNALSLVTAQKSIWKGALKCLESGEGEQKVSKALNHCPAAEKNEILLTAGL